MKVWRLATTAVSVAPVLLLTGCPGLLAISRNGGPGDLQNGNHPTVETTVYDKLPNTADGAAVHAFSDQPSQSNPLDKTVLFAATHFAGVQKMTHEARDRFATVNPNWFQLHYRLGVASGPSAYLHGDTWASDWAQVTLHDDWFLRDTNGHRSESTPDNGSWDLHDLTSPAFQSYWLNNVAADIKATGSDGVFADSFMGGVGCALLQTGQCDPRLQGTGASDPALWENGYTWLDRLNDWAALVQLNLHTLPGKPLFIPNLDALNTFWAVSRLNLNALDGAFLENFPTANKNADYVRANNNALTLTANDKVVILQCVVNPSSVDERLFVVTTYLMLKGKRTFLNMMGGNTDTGFYWWPEYEVVLGKPLQPTPILFTTLSWQGAYRRDFEKGLALVNPKASPQVVTLPNGVFYEVTPTGGGGIREADINAQGGVAGQSVSYRQVSGSYTLNAWSGAILLFAQP